MKIIFKQGYRKIQERVWFDKVKVERMLSCRHYILYIMNVYMKTHKIKISLKIIIYNF